MHSVVQRGANIARQHYISAIFAPFIIEKVQESLYNSIVEVIHTMTLKEIRKTIGYTQEQASDYLQVSLRSYKSYENDADKVGTIKYKYMEEMLGKLNQIDEEHGILKIEDIKQKCSDIFIDYNIDYCYLFGSYSKGKAKENSDVDLLISSTVKGLKFYGLVEKISNSLRKKVDLLDMGQVVNNPELLNEILKDGIKIYG